MFSNTELERLSLDALRVAPQMQRFLSWVATKPPDFHVPTARTRGNK